MAGRESASLMAFRTPITNWPLAWKVPLLAASLMIGVAVVISQLVLNRLEADQENNLRQLTSAYLDGLSAAVLPSAVRADVWEAFDALDRARDHYAGVKVHFAIVELPNGKVLAASDPAKFPVQSAVPSDFAKRFSSQDGLVIDNNSGQAWVERTLSEQGFSVGRILAEIEFPNCCACGARCCSPLSRSMPDLRWDSRLLARSLLSACWSP